MMMDGWTTLCSIMVMEKRFSLSQLWSFGGEEIGDEGTFETHSFPWNVVSVALLCTGWSPNPSREASDYKDTPTYWHTTGIVQAITQISNRQAFDHKGTHLIAF